ncbi:MAG: hypothetical protein Q8K92_09220 [Leadbetterella sp.]|nr:hypothetical protein [Leadbetterella sp.]
MEGLFQIFMFGLYAWLCQSTAKYHRKKHKFDVDFGTILCIVLTPLIGGMILVYRPFVDSEEDNASN